MIGGGAIWHAKHLLDVRDPPTVSTEPVLSIALDPRQHLSWAHDIEYQATEGFAGCHNPVTVVVDALVNGAEIPGSSSTPAGYVHGELSDPMRASRPVTVFDNTTDTFPVHWTIPSGYFSRRHGYFSRGNGQSLFFGAPVRAWYPSSTMVGMAAASSVLSVLVELRFRANWVLPRSSGTCFVRFPTIQSATVDPTSPPDTTLASPPPGPAEVSVLSSSGATIASQLSIPPPSDVRIPMWRCQSTAVAIAQENQATGGAANCGGVAVFTTPGAESHVALWLLIDGALIGVAAALFVEPAIKFQRPLKRQPEE